MFSGGYRKRSVASNGLKLTKKDTKTKKLNRWSILNLHSFKSPFINGNRLKNTPYPG